MSAKYLNRVLKTVLAGSVKLPAPADRVGFGVKAVIDQYPTAFLSQGHFLTPRLSEPEHRSEWTVADDESMPPPDRPGMAGSAHGPSARRAVYTTATAPLAGIPTGTVTPTAPATPRKAVKPSRVSRPWFSREICPAGRDCQSPGRQTHRRNRIANRLNRRWRRTANPASAAGLQG